MSCLTAASEASADVPFGVGVNLMQARLALLAPVFELAIDNALLCHACAAAMLPNAASIAAYEKATSVLRLRVGQAGKGFTVHRWARVVSKAAYAACDFLLFCQVVVIGRSEVFRYRFIFVCPSAAAWRAVVDVFAGEGAWMAGLFATRVSILSR